MPSGPYKRQTHKAVIQRFRSHRLVSHHRVNVGLGLHVFFGHKTFVYNKTKITINIRFLSDTYTFYGIVVQFFNNVFADFSKALDSAINAQIATYTIHN